MVSKGLLIVSILVLAVSYNIYHEFIPPGSTQPLLLKSLFLLNRVLDNSMKFLASIGVADYLYLRRVSLEIGTMISNRNIDGVVSEDMRLEGVAVRIFRPDSLSTTNSNPAMVYYHGGGWTIGSINTHHAMTAYFAKEVGMLVISVDYRLNPEYSRRDGFDDCLAVTKYLINNAAAFNVDPTRVVIAGDSAGGNFAAAISLELRDQSFSPLPKIQMLIYPAVQGIDFSLPSYQQNSKGPFLTEFDLYWYTSHNFADGKDYMPYFFTNTHVSGDVRVAMANGILNHGVFPNENKYDPYKLPNYETGDSEIWDDIKQVFLDPYHYPLMAPNHANLPEAYIFTGQYDMIRDEGYLYAGMLRDAGVEVTHYNCPIGWHGMTNMLLDLKDSQEVMDRMCEFLRNKL